MASSQGVQLHQPHRPPSPKLVNEGIREYVHTAQYGVTNGSQAWRLKSEIPSSDEIMGVDVSCAGDEMQLAPNVVDGPWPSKDAYLKSHYELLREDAVAPLRDAVAYVRNDRQMMDSRDMSVYEKVC